MSTRRSLLAVLGLATLSAALPSVAQQPVKVWRIGFLAVRSRPSASNPDVYDEFPRGMRELGYVEGKNFVIEWRYADGKNERLPGLAAELVRLKVDVLVAPANYAAHAARQATTTIPIVTFMADPVGEGLVASLARPGGNITGLSMVPVNLGPKHLELLKTMAPAISRVAIVLNPGNSTHPRTLSAVEAAAKKVGVQILPVEASTSEEIEQGFAGLTRERA
ncbi:MAG: ABC transporter substrate-binding protein, partial [Terriglobales bacterium]